MALTKVTGQVIKNTTDVTVGVLTVTNTLAVGGTVSIGGTLTYEDVTNVDAVGLITARNGIVVGSGITLSKDGDGFFTGIVTATSFAGDGSALTGVASTDNIRTNTNATFLQNINVSGSTTTGSLVSSGAISGTTGTFSGAVQTVGLTNTIASGNVIALLDSSNASQNHRVRINSQGASSSTSLVISNSNANNQTSLVHGNDGVFTIRNGQTAGSEPTSGSERLRIGSDGAILVSNSTGIGIGAATNGSSTYPSVTISGTSGGAVHFEDDGDLLADIYGSSSGLSLSTRKTSDAIIFQTNSGTVTEKARIDSSGNVLIADSAGQIGKLSTLGTGNHISAIRHSTDTSSANFLFAKYRGSRSSPAIIVNGDTLGDLAWYGYNGSSIIKAASVSAVTSSTVDGSNMPTDLIFKTTAGNTNSEQVRITSGGRMGIGKSSDISCALHVYHASNNEQARFESGDEYVHITFKDSTTTSEPYIGAQGNNFRIITGGGERISINSSGAISNGTTHTQGQTFVTLKGSGAGSNFSVMVFGANSGGHNTSSCAVALGKHSSNNRSLNAAGTVNASGNDYAEYMTKSGDFTIAKGDICGIDANGKLTNKFSESISFVVKSTDPSYVGGDVWGTEEILGEKPDDDSSDLPAFEEKLEAARKMVDRIAFS